MSEGPELSGQSFPPSSSDPELDRVIGASGFIFSGRIRKVGTATMDVVPVTKDTAVVVVEEVLLAPDDFGERRGQEVTVQLRSEAKRGQKGIFFTIGWMSGTSLAVQELGRRPSREVTRLRKEVPDSLQRMRETELQRRLGEATAVVLGRVVRVRPVGDSEPVPASEHDPLWRLAIVAVESVEKGPLGQDEVEVAYPSSRDVMWFRAPKLAEGQVAVLLLHGRKLDDIDIVALAVVDPIDVQPSEQLDYIRGLLRRVQ